MKNLIALLISLCCLSATSKASSVEEAVIDKLNHPEIGFEIKEKTTFKNGQWIVSQKDIYSFNKHGEIAVKTTQTSYDGVLFENKAKTEYSYDKHGKLTGKTEYEIINSNFEISSFTSYSYTFFNELKEVNCYEKKNGNWDVVKKSEYIYDIKRQLMKTIESREVNGQLTQAITHEFSYTDNMLTKDLTKELDNGKWVKAGYTNYEYNKSKELIKYTEYGPEAINWIPLHTATFQYTKHKLSSYKVEKISATSKVVLKHWLAQYDRDKNLTDVVKKEHNGNQLVIAEKIKFLPPASTSIQRVEENKTDLKVYPVPARDFVKIEKNNQNDEINWTLINITGKVLQQGKLNSFQTTEQLDLTALSNGIYFIRSTDSLGNQFTNRISVSK